MVVGKAFPMPWKTGPIDATCDRKTPEMLERNILQPLLVCVAQTI
jgi:hypothetical protein